MHNRHPITDPNPLRTGLLACAALHTLRGVAFHPAEISFEHQPRFVEHEAMPASRGSRIPAHHAAGYLRSLDQRTAYRLHCDPYSSAARR